MVKRNEIVAFCNNYLEVEKFKDYCYNGLQIEGIEDISKIVTGVSLSKRLIDEAILENAEMLIVHHGLFKNQLGDPPRIVGIFKERIKLIIENGINLCGYHLPLDAHNEIGNNIELCRRLELLDIERLASPYYGDIGYVGLLKIPSPIEDFVLYVDKKLGTKSFVIAAGETTVRKVGVISGGSSSDYGEAFRMGADTFITGDIKENIVREVEELGINFINAGHYNTEKFGIRKLGALLKEEFDIPTKFIDIPNEI
ncbi:MAG TPA: Nif3-like dinuclear metal center hexameric protein [Candidatus Cloacimonetes bacterium]|nr:Nif3-like dinuclear metal center hexameric protein [Candidatus Cloacimonadota bacterium]HEX37560.1 Nif3-like dinuclear metal center hexameric protein [Candidatus Cloacimonadota bacterium]